MATVGGIPVKLGVDIGGTFTDVALEIGRKLVSTKVLTNYDQPEQAILDGIAEVVTQAEIGVGEIDILIHGTTLATNSLIERRGAKMAFVTTEGFRDVIEMRTENRFEQYDLNLSLPTPLVSREHRYVVSERIDAHGRVLKPIDRGEIETLVETFEKGDYKSVAIGFIHAYLNGEHERRVRDVLSARLPELSLSISSEISPQIREFDRFNTVCANAYVKPQMKSYLGRLVSRLEQVGVQCQVFMMHSGGGIITVDNASDAPVRLVESGPAGGAIFAAHIARCYSLDSVVSYDMGGTTAKICLIEEQNPRTAKTFEVARTYRFKKGSGMPISIPVIEMVEIGAGGGSIGWVDSLRQIQVGPESAGSEPGPSCYQLGGDKPTVTDADLRLGKLDPDKFAGGSIILSTEAATEALNKEIGQKLDLDSDVAAFGICEMVDENMANAARVHAVENGKDISNYTMIAFGGAAPLHAARICEKLGLRSLLIPPGAGVGSAIGFLRAPFSYEAVRGTYMRLSQFDADAVNRLLSDLTKEVDAFVRAGMGEGELIREIQAFMRYGGQGWEIPVHIPSETFQSNDSSRFADWFVEAYSQFFGRPIEGLDIEIVSWSVRGSSPLPPVEKLPVHEAKIEAQAAGARRVFDARSQTFFHATVVERESMKPGMFVAGPAVIVERETSTIVTAAYQAVMQQDGCLLITRISGAEGVGELGGSE